VRGSNLVEALKLEQIRDPFQLLGCFLAGPGPLRRFSEGAPVNTDTKPVVLFGAPLVSNRDGNPGYGTLLHLLDTYSSDGRELLAPKDAASGFANDLADFIAARNTFLHGLVAEAEGDKGRAIDAYVESARRSRWFVSGYAHCVTVAMQEAKVNPVAARRLLQRLAEAQPSRPVAGQLLQRLLQRTP
jgi:spermidine synthase